MKKKKICPFLIRRQTCCCYASNMSENEIIVILITLKRRHIIECINHLIKGKESLMHARCRLVDSFIMNFIAAYNFLTNRRY